MITAIAFDGNGVLYYRDRDFGAALMEYIRNRHVADFSVTEGAKLHLHYMYQAFDGAITKDDAVRLFLDAAGIEDPAARKDIAAKELEFSKRVSLFPTEKETLLELSRRGFKLGMITNSYQSAAEKASWFRAFGLDCIAETVVSSIDAGVSKPEPGIYLEFARRLSLPPCDLAFVGHESYELQGARRAGFLPVSFNCEKEIREKDHLSRFSDLLDMFPSPGSTRGL